MVIVDAWCTPVLAIQLSAKPPEFSVMRLIMRQLSEIFELDTSCRLEDRASGIRNRQNDE
jgi:hypothetical protein